MAEHKSAIETSGLPYSRLVGYWLPALLFSALLVLTLGRSQIMTGSRNLAWVSALNCLVDLAPTVETPPGTCYESLAKIFESGDLSGSRKNLEVDSYERFLTADNWQHQSAITSGVAVPTGLITYLVAMAKQQANLGEWNKSLEYFQRAVVYQPYGWPVDFYVRYREALAHGGDGVREDGRTILAEPQIRVGLPGIPGWDMPIRLADNRQLIGFSIGNWAELENGLPFDLRLFWIDDSGQVASASTPSENWIPNGGFELGDDWTPPNLAGWFAEKQSDLPQPEVDTRSIYRTNLTSTALIIPSLPDDQVSVDVRRIDIVPGTKQLLWSGWIEAMPGATPIVYVFWLDDDSNVLSYEIVFSAVSQDNGRHYAGVLSVPDGATGLSLRLANWKGSNVARFDDILISPF